MSTPISVVVTTFNREDALDAVLRSLAGQRDRGFEVIVADDGSGPATAALVRQWMPQKVSFDLTPLGFLSTESKTLLTTMSEVKKSATLSDMTLAPFSVYIGEIAKSPTSNGVK